MIKLSFDGREIVEPLEVGYVTAAAKGTGADTANSVGAYNTSTTWAAGSQDILSGAHFAWKILANLSLNTRYALLLS
jgi:hypothetical protein